MKIHQTLSINLYQALQHEDKHSHFAENSKYLQVNDNVSQEENGDDKVNFKCDVSYANSAAWFDQSNHRSVR